MNNRFIVKETQLDKDHPINPNTTVWRLYDRITKTYSMSYYMSKERAEVVAKKKNV